MGHCSDKLAIQRGRSERLRMDRRLGLFVAVVLLLPDANQLESDLFGGHTSTTGYLRISLDGHLRCLLDRGGCVSSPAWSRPGAPSTEWLLRRVLHYHIAWCILLNFCLGRGELLDTPFSKLQPCTNSVFNRCGTLLLLAGSG